MARYLKTGINEDVRASEDAKVRSAVEAILADIDAREDASVKAVHMTFVNNKVVEVGL